MTDAIQPFSNDVERIDPDRIETDLVSSHVRCVGCAYDLFGQRTRARCPECGREVNDSLGVDLLHVDPAIVDRVRIGTYWLLGRTALSPLCTTLFILSLVRPRHAAFMLLAVIAMLVCEWCAIHFLTSLEATAATSLRTFQSIATSAYVLLLLSLRLTTGNRFDPNVTLLGLGFLCLTIAAMRFELLHRTLARLSERAGDARLAEELRSAGLMSTMFGLVFTGGLAAMLLSGNVVIVIALGMIATVIGAFVTVGMWFVVLMAHVEFLGRINRVAAR